MGSKIDMTGMKFGQLTVIEFDKNNGHASYWKCQCMCGKICSVNRYSLLHGQPSCGCKIGTFNLIGKQFGRLLVIGYSHSNNGLYWNCLCECGEEVIVSGSNLRTGSISSCGCKRHNNTIPNEIYSWDLYNHWKSMIHRCKIDLHYRDIKICAEWKEFKNFYYDLIDEYIIFITNRPNEIPSLERKDIYKYYEKCNCCWIPRYQQAWNRRTTKLNIDLANEIRQKFSTGNYMIKDLIFEYNVAGATIRAILLNLSWVE